MLRLEIVTPERTVFNETVDSVTIPTAKGEAGILPLHAPLISTIKPGILAYSKGAATERMVVSGGFVEISADVVSVLADTVEKASEIDAEAARAERESCEKLLGSWSGTAEEFATERERLQRAQARLQLVGK
jgi:F-type H+-transporting ATPase subunit epsilon